MVSIYGQLVIIDRCKAFLRANGRVEVFVDGSDTKRLHLVFNDLEAARTLASEMARLIDAWDEMKGQSDG